MPSAALASAVAVRVPRGQPIAPFGDTPAELPVLNRPLHEVQVATLRAAGVDLVDAPPPGRPYLLVSDRAWFTVELVRRLIKSKEHGRLSIVDPDWVAQGDPMLPDRQRPEVAWVAPGAPPSFDGLPDLALPLDLKKEPAAVRHPAFAHAAARGWVGGRALAHDVDHWVHVLRVNLLALAARGAEARADFDEAGPLGKLGRALPVLWRAGRLDEASLLRAISRVSPRAKVHPTAVIEASELADGAEVGPFAVVRGCILAEDVKVEAHACITGVIAGRGATIGRNVAINLCVLMDGAFVSWGPTRQMSVFGRDSFVAQDNQLIDLSFGQTIRVDHRGSRVDTGAYFLGSAVGHRAKIGAGVRVGYGMAVPNDALLVAPPEDLLRAWPDVIDGPAVVRDGRAVPARRG